MSSDTSPQQPTLPPQTARFIHDLRNGLASMRAAANMLQRSEKNAEVIDQVAEGIQREVRQLVTLIDEFIGRDARGEPVVPTTTPPQPTTTLNVLVADDNMDSANTLAMYLRMEGHRVVVAFDGEQALQLATGNPPDVMLLDINMPTTNGYELARQIRSQHWGTGIRLVAMSGYLSAEDQARASAVGFDAQLGKPIDMDLLQTILQPAA